MFIKYLFLAIISIGIFVLAVFDVNAMDYLHKGGIIIAFIIGLLILNFFAKIAWRLLILIILITLVLYVLNYFGIVEFSASGVANLFKEMINLKPIVAPVAETASTAAGK